MKKAILTSGLPAAGKSTVIKQQYEGFLKDATLIDPDEILKEHKDYNPSNPQPLHEWSKQEAKKRMNRAMADGRNLVIDGTGTNAEKMVKWIKDLQAYGYEVILVFVKVSIKTSIQRNAARERNVPEWVIREKAEVISTSFEITSSYVDKVVVINND